MATEQVKKVQSPSAAIVEYVAFGGDSKVKLSIEIVKRLICVPTRSGKICSDEDAMKFMGLCNARKLNPWEGDCYLIGYDGREGPTFSLITSHQAFLKRAEVNPEYDGMESGVVIEQNGEIKDIQVDFTTAGQKVLGGWARVYFKNRSHPMYKRVRLSRFQKNFGVWVDDSPGMICKCAEADALRSSFPTMLGGMYLAAEKEPPTIEILEPKIEKISNGSDTAEEQKTSPPSSIDLPHTAAVPTPESPVRKKSRLKPKEESQPEPSPFESTDRAINRKKIDVMLGVAGYNEFQFLAVANKNEWLGKGRTWDNMDDVPDDMLEVFLMPDEWRVVLEQIAKLPQHTKD